MIASVDLLFTGADLYTLNEDQPVIRNGAIAVVGNSIAAMGPAAEVAANCQHTKRSIDCSGTVIMPGLIDAHSHQFQLLGRTLGDGMSLLPWLAKFMLPLAAALDPRNALAAVELLALNSALSGTTAVVDNHYGPVDESTTIAVAQTMERVGIRGAVARGVFGPMVEGGVRMNCDERLFKYSAREELEIIEACLKQQPASSLVQIWPTPENVVYVDKELMQACLELAERYDVSWHSHLSESKFEVEIHESIHGQRPVKWLHDNGILSDRTTFAHGIWLDEEEIELLGNAKSTIIHNPVSNQFLASGIVKLGPLLRAGANVALGTDGVAVAGQDMFESMKSAQMLQHLREYDAESTSAELMLDLACRNGGQMLRKNVGILKVGALADFISVDLRGPHNQPATRAVCCLTSSARGSDVRHVVVDGQHIVSDGRSTKIDEDKVIADALQATGQIIRKAGISELVQAWKNPEHHYSSKSRAH
ncbi:MAG: amidohydrolase family protein [Burkholderiaceae bacterium]|nr:amidohydrolase family protein [Burkholderiaceae bacterium]